MSESLSFFATCPQGLGSILANELADLGAEGIKASRAGAHFFGGLKTAYRACLWSRTASRVLLRLGTFRAATTEELYEGIRTLPWHDHLASDGTLAVHCAHTRSPLDNTLYAALKVKDAIVDQLRERTGQRPNVDLKQPDVRIHVHLLEEQATVSIDLAGESLHRRRYRQDGLKAPIKENLAAGLLLLAGWPELCLAGAPLLDPMCGSGTFVLEAGLMAADRAPGLLRSYFGFLRWRGHRPELWASVIEEAHARARSPKRKLPPIVGYDADAAAIKTALAAVERAGLRGLVHFERRELQDCLPPAQVSSRSSGSSGPSGLLMVNPPYGQRLGATETLIPLYTRLGDLLKKRFAGWTAQILAGNEELTRFIGLRSSRRVVVFNGNLECRLLCYPIVEGKLERNFSVRGKKKIEENGGAPSATIEERPIPARVPPEEGLDSEHVAEPHEESAPGIEMFANRLRKNLKHLRRWAKREGISCYRLYDADLPEYAVAVDLYDHWVHVQEYAPPKTVDEVMARKRLRQVLSILPQILEVAPADVSLKIRRRQNKEERYTKLQSEGELHEVAEGGCRFLVNLTDYLDTGLFLDHRLTRELIRDLSSGRSFLNLFCYTATATVYAAKGGARTTTSVDLSQTYLDWAERNFQLNGLVDPRHELIRADCLEWMKSQSRRFGLIFLDVPTFSNSKAMQGTFDVQRDHVWLVRDAATLLEPEGILLFSNNYRRFKLEAGSLDGLHIEDISPKTLPKDFSRNPRIHHTWLISR